jgi:acyl-CoA reductase-like NAD-dependent aldehyde dehydrogenase
LNYIKIGKEEGAEVITGGTNWSKAPDGYYVMPTILGGTNGSMRVVQEEVRLSHLYFEPHCFVNVLIPDLWTGNRSMQIQD